MLLKGELSILIHDGEFNEEIPKYIGKSKEWLYDELRPEGYSTIKDILYAEWSETDGFFTKTYNENKDGIKKGD